MAGSLKSPQRHQLHHAADMQAGGGRVKTDVDRLQYRMPSSFARREFVGALMDQSAPAKFVQVSFVSGILWFAEPGSLRRRGGLRGK